MSCRFPGADNYQEFWENLDNGICSVTEIPESKWDWRRYYGDPVLEKNKTNCKWGGVLSDIETFDPQFFDVSPREAQWMDPQQRILLEVAWQCIEDAGYIPKELAGKNIGVFVGIGTFDYQELQNRECEILEGHRGTGVFNSIIANRISYFYNFHGPSLPVDTACSGSLVSLHLAMNAIKQGECEAALAGGVSLLVTPTNYISFSQLGMLSPTGICKTFDESADGYVRGEGCGLVFLKPLSKAIEDGDNIVGVIKGTAINHGGKARTLTSPSAISQSKVVVSAFNSANVSPDTVNYIETHGTGTPLGDPIEIHGLNRAYKNLSKLYGVRLRDNFCGLGAVKTNIGHLEPAAGIAGIIKVLLAMKYRTLPPLVNYKKLNTRISLSDTPFFIVDKKQEWKPVLAKDGSPMPLRAGVSSFGYGGLNSHIILEQAPTLCNDVKTKKHVNLADCAGSEGSQPLLLTVSANNKESLQELANSYSALLRNKKVSPGQICLAANTRRTVMPHRLAIVGADKNELIAGLENYVRSDLPSVDSVFVTGLAAGDTPKVAFMFSGQGSQFCGMGRELYDSYQVVREQVDKCDGILQPILGMSIRDLIFGTDNVLLGRTKYTQPALFVIEYALAKLWMTLGVTPTVLIGHSVGELTAACIAEVLTLEDALRIVAKRGELMDQVPSDGAMAAVFSTVSNVRTVLDETQLDLDIAVVNAPDNVVVSGEKAEVEKAMDMLARAGVQSRRLNVSQAFHSKVIEPVLDEFLEVLKDIEFSPAKLTVISNVTGTVVSEELQDPKYWVSHIRQPVLFEAGIKSVHSVGGDVFLEIGPNTVLSGLAKHCLGEKARYLESMIGDRNANLCFLNTVAKLFVAGCEPQLGFLTDDALQGKVDIPVYPFKGKKYWLPKLATLKKTRPAAEIPLLGRRVEIALKEMSISCYECVLPDDLGEYVFDHQVKSQPIMPAAAYVAQFISAVLDAAIVPKMKSVSLKKVKFHKPMNFNQGPYQAQTIIQKDQHTNAWQIIFMARMEKSKDWQCYATALFEAEETTLPENQVYFNPAYANNGEQTKADVDEFYKRCAASGLEYGDGFRAIEELSFCDHTAQGYIKLPKYVSAEIGGSLVPHPVLLDNAFQILASLIKLEKHPGKIPLPVEIEAISVFGPVHTELNVRVSLRKDAQSNASQAADLYLFNKDNQLVAQVKGLKVIWADVENILSDGKIDPLRDICFSPKWRILDAQKEAMVRNPSPETNVARAVCVYTEASTPLLESMKRVVETGFTAEIVLGRKNRKIGANKWEVDCKSLEAFDSVLAKLPVFNTVFYLGTTAPVFDRISDYETSSSIQGVCLDSLFYLLKSLARSFSERSLSFNLFTTASLQVLSNERVQPFGAGAWGLVRCVCNEIKQWKAYLVDAEPIQLSGHSSNREPDSTAKEMLMANKHLLRISQANLDDRNWQEVALREGRYYTRVLELHDGKQDQGRVFKDGGVYVIAGGGGGIGTELAQYIMNSAHAHVILLGRSALESAHTEINRLIKNSNGNLSYIQADITQPESVQTAIKEIKAQYGSISGVVHSAAVVQDRSFQNMDINMFFNALQPKVAGSINLALAVKDEPLDFMLFFSSAMSLLAYAGQANYVAANAFQDAFARDLNQLVEFPVVSINWGFWGETGVAARDYYRERFAAMGVSPIQNSEGMEAVRRALSLNEPQLVVVRAKLNVLREMSVDNPSLDAISAHSSGASEISGGKNKKVSLISIEELSQMPLGEVSKEILNGIGELLGEVLRFNAEREFGGMEKFASARLTSLGIDSLTTVELRTRVKKWLGVDIPAELMIGGGRVSEVVDLINQKMLLQRLSHRSSTKKEVSEDEEVLVL